LTEAFFGIPARAVHFIVQLMQDNGSSHAFTLDDLVDYFGYTVIHAKTTPVVCGATFKEEHLILINKVHPPQRQEVALAHELGHIVIDQMPRKEGDEYREEMLEDYCDTFAVLLLSDMQKRGVKSGVSSTDLLHYNPEVGVSLMGQGACVILFSVIDWFTEANYESEAVAKKMKTVKIIAGAVIGVLAVALLVRKLR
jgi:hypothetical protein